VLNSLLVEPERPPELAGTYRTAGLWSTLTLAEFAWSALADNPGRSLYLHAERDTFVLPFPRLLDLARRVASELVRRAAREGTPVVVALPTCAEGVALFIGALLAGAAPVPIPASVSAAHLDQVLAVLPDPILIAREGAVDGRALGCEVWSIANRTPTEILSELEACAHPVSEPARTSPDGVGLVAHTAGSTNAMTRGVLYTHRAMLAELTQLYQAQPSPGPRIVCAPFGHALGLLGGVLCPLYAGESIHLLETWRVPRVIDLMRTHGAGSGSGPPFFLESLLATAALADALTDTSKWVALGGAPISAELIQRAEQRGISAFRYFGSSEHPSATGTGPGDQPDTRHHTNGRPLLGVELRIVDEFDAELGRGSAGMIETRGPDTFSGYTQPSDNPMSLRRDGWIRTGDIGVLDELGSLRVVGRTSEIINRAGEKIHPSEIEEACRRFVVGEFVVLGMPHRLFGEEVVVAFVAGDRPRPISSVSELRKQLGTTRLAKTRWPTRMVPVDTLPLLPSGKVDRAALSEALARTEVGHS
jgi:acyl-CoA synthetase (AMP-forming)/AMP-acid ligase II